MSDHQSNCCRYCSPSGAHCGDPVADDQDYCQWHSESHKASTHAKHIVEKIAQEDGSLAGYQLQQTDLQKANLIGANLEDTNLQRANLSGAHLYGANLQGADLFKANLSCANLKAANLAGSNLLGPI